MAVLHRRWLASRLFSTTYIIYEKATLKKLCIEMVRSSKKEKGKAKKTFLHVFIAKRLDWLSVACRSFAILTAVAVPYYNISKDSPAIRPKMMLITIDGYIHVENAKYGLHTHPQGFISPIDDLYLLHVIHISSTKKSFDV